MFSLLFNGITYHQYETIWNVGVFGGVSLIKIYTFF